MKHTLTISIIALVGCAACSSGSRTSGFSERIIPAEEYSRSIKSAPVEDFSIFKIADQRRALQEQEAAAAAKAGRAADARGSLEVVADGEPIARAYQGDARYVAQGLQLARSFEAPKTEFVSDGVAVEQGGGVPFRQPLRLPPQLPPGSRSPYAAGQMTGNPSLWPDEAQGAFLFSDFRAFQAMDVITITINESSEGNKKTKTDTQGSFSLAAGIKEFFGLETKTLTSNNESLNPEELISATTSTKFEGEGETNRSGKLKAQISAVILEVLPNGLMRVEGTKIMSVDNEEEVMVISGLVRPRDVTSQNQVESNRIANMRVDFYGRGVLAEKQGPGWGARIFEKVWPF